MLRVRPRRCGALGAPRPSEAAVTPRNPGRGSRGGGTSFVSVSLTVALIEPLGKEAEKAAHTLQATVSSTWGRTCSLWSKFHPRCPRASGIPPPFRRPGRVGRRRRLGTGARDLEGRRAQSESWPGGKVPGPAPPGDNQAAEDNRRSGDWLPRLSPGSPFRAQAPAKRRAAVRLGEGAGKGGGAGPARRSTAPARAAYRIRPASCAPRWPLFLLRYSPGGGPGRGEARVVCGGHGSEPEGERAARPLRPRSGGPRK